MENLSKNLVVTEPARNFVPSATAAKYLILLVGPDILSWVRAVENRSIASLLELPVTMTFASSESK